MTATTVPPSWFVRQARSYYVWCIVVECPGCGLRAHYADCHPTEPCPACGLKALREQVGRWQPPRRTWYGRVVEPGRWVLVGEP